MSNSHREMKQNNLPTYVTSLFHTHRRHGSTISEVSGPGTGLMSPLILVLLFLFGPLVQKSLRLCRVKFDRDEIWQECSRSKYTSFQFRLTESDLWHDVWIRSSWPPWRIFTLIFNLFFFLCSLPKNSLTPKIMAATCLLLSLQLKKMAEDDVIRSSWPPWRIFTLKSVAIWWVNCSVCQAHMQHHSPVPDL